MKRILIGVLAVVVIAGGIIAGRGRARRQVSHGRTSLTALTTITNITDYGANGAVIGVYTKIRKQYSDGSWKNRVEFSNGKVRESSGRINLADVTTPEVYAANAIARGNTKDTFLGYTVYVQRDPNGTEFWFSPDLDATLKEVEYNKKTGKLESISEVVSIQLGQPENQSSLDSMDSNGSLIGSRYLQTAKAREIVGGVLVTESLSKPIRGGQAWYSPEQDAQLKNVVDDKDGDLSSVLEAIEISIGEPSKGQEPTERFIE